MSKRDSPSSFFSAPSKRVLVIDDEEDDDSSDCVVVSISTPHIETSDDSSSCDSFSDDDSSDDCSFTPDLYNFLRDPAHREHVMYSQEDTAIFRQIMHGDGFTDFNVWGRDCARRVYVTDTRDAPYMEQKPAPSQEYYNTQQRHTPSPNQEAGLAFCVLRREGNSYASYLCKDLTREIGQYVQSA